MGGGTINWSNGLHSFFGNLIRTGGTFVPDTGKFNFAGVANQQFSPGPGGVALISLVVQGSSTQVLDVMGDVSVREQFALFSDGPTINLAGTVALTAPSSSFTLVNTNTTLNIETGSVLDALAATLYVNGGAIVEIGTGKILRSATGVGFTDASGTPVGSVLVGDDVFITLFDEDENINGTIPDTTQVAVESLTTGDVETLILTETGNQSEVFRNLVGLPTAVGSANPGDGVLQHGCAGDLAVTYADDEDTDDTLESFVESVTEEAPCDDGLFCTTAETCTAGVCGDGSRTDCSDGIECTIDSCDENNDECINTPSDTFCDDGLWCNGFETCDPIDDCQASTAPNCDDGVGCTDDSCDEHNDGCVNTPNDGLCDDRLWCNGFEVCAPDVGCQVGTEPCPPGACDEVNDECSEQPIPTVSEWGLLIMTLLLLTGIKLKFGWYQPDQA